VTSSLNGSLLCDEAEKVITNVFITGTSTPQTSNPNPAGLERAEAALSQALERLETTKNELESKGNTNAALAIDKIIGRLNNMADERITNKGKNDNNGNDNENKSGKRRNK